MRIDGFKFHDSQLDYLKSYNGSESYSLTAASLTMLLLLHSKCDSLGRINRNSLNITRISAEMEIPYSTLHSGLQTLLGRGQVRRELKTNQFDELTEYYVIANYSDLDVNGNVQTYFHVPKKLFKTNILGLLVASKNVEGILFLLELFKRFSHTKNIQSASYKYYFSSIVNEISKHTSKTSKTIRRILKQAISLFQKFFFVTPGKGRKFDSKLRKDLKRGITNNPGVDMRHSYYELKIDNDLLHAEEEYRHKNILFNVSKTIRLKLEDNKIKYTQEQLDSLIYTMRYDVINVLSPSLKEDELLSASVRYAESCTDVLIKNLKVTEDIFFNTGGFFRTVVRANLKNFIVDTTSNMIDVLFNYYNLHGHYPHSIQ